MLGMLFVLFTTTKSIFPHFENLLLSPAPKNGISITFDDGPHSKYTAPILDILKEKDVKATFFVIGLHIPRGSSLLRREIREGHEIGGHSYSHQNLSKLPLIPFAQEVLFPNMQIFLITGRYPKYFRFPYGVDDIRITKYFHGRVIGWNVDSYDWRGGKAKILAENIISQVKTGSIILLHDIKKDTVAALPLIIDGVRAKGFEFTSLSSLLLTVQVKEREVVYYSQKNTNKLHDHQVKKKEAIPSSEQGFAPIKIETISHW